MGICVLPNLSKLYFPITHHCMETQGLAEIFAVRSMFLAPCSTSWSVMGDANWGWKWSSTPSSTTNRKRAATWDDVKYFHHRWPALKLYCSRIFIINGTRLDHRKKDNATLTKRGSCYTYLPCPIRSDCLVFSHIFVARRIQTEVPIAVLTAHVHWVCRDKRKD